MKKPKFRLPAVSLSTAGKYCALLACMILMNFALPAREPFAFPLYYAALCCGFDPLIVSAEYLISSVASVNVVATLSALSQAAILLLIFALYRKTRTKMRLERLVYIAVAQLPFLFLFPHEGYAVFPFPVIWQKVVIAFFIFILSAFFEGAFYSLLHRVFRCRLTAGQLAELLLGSVVLGLGVCGALGETVFLCVAISLQFMLLIINSSTTALSLAQT